MGESIRISSKVVLTQENVTHLKVQPHVGDWEAHAVFNQ